MPLRLEIHSHCLYIVTIILFSGWTIEHEIRGLKSFEVTFKQEYGIMLLLDQLNETINGSKILGDSIC